MKLSKLLFVASLLSLSQAYAANKPNMVPPMMPYPLLNKVSYQLTMDKWVKSDTAKVFVSIDANLNDSDINTFQQQVKKNLSHIAGQVDWHISRYLRNQDQSGLENIALQAQARIPTQQLNGLRAKAKSMSKPGMTYRIADIDYSPSLQDIEKTKNTLRQAIFQKVEKEISLLDKIYNEDFFVHHIDFDMTPPPAPFAQMRALAPSASNMSSMRRGSSDSAMNISQQVVINANVVLASSIDNIDKD